MDKVIVNYVQKIYPGIIFNDIVEEEIEKRSPKLVHNDGMMQGFRFYDIEFIIDKGKTYSSGEINFSKWIYYGTRYSIEEIIAKHSGDHKFRVLIKNMVDNAYDYACLTQTGKYQPMRDGDMTYDEYLQKENKKVKRLGKQF